MSKPIKLKNQKADPLIDFVNLASHQLRTPLSGTKWLLELMQKSGTGNLNRKQRDFIEKIYSSNERMIALVNDLLEVARIDQGRTKLYFQPTDLDAIIRNLIQEKAQEIQKKRLEINFTAEPEPFPKVRTESNKIKQSVLNLLSNAIAYTLEGGSISVDLKTKNGMALCSITDTGVGIPKPQQKRIFSKFFRGSNVTSIEASGTGLGLYIAKSFIEASGGKISFKSQEGQGTTFYFTLPVAK